MKIKNLLLSVMGILCLIAISAIAWNTRQVYKEYQEAERIVFSNQVAQISLKLSTQLAYERGFSATLIASQDLITQEMKTKFSIQQKNTDTLYQKFLQKLENADSLFKNPLLFQNIARLNNFRDQQLKLRAIIQHEIFVGVGKNSKQIQDKSKYLQSQWIILLTDSIQQISLIRQIIMLPTNSRDFATYYSLMAKEIFHTYTETVGLQRVIIGKSIMENRFLTTEELMKLQQQQHLLVIVEEKLNNLLQFFPPSKQSQLAREVFIKQVHLQYNQLYQKILSSSFQQKTYKITAFEWFEKATLAIAEILKYSQAIDLQITNKVDHVKQQSNTMILSLVAVSILVAILFVLAYLITYRRIINPLSLLEKAATVIANGDMKQVVHLENNDEFSKLGDTFDLMRRNLLEDIHQREAVEMELRKLHNAMLHSLNSVVITNNDGFIEYVNPCFEAASGYVSNELIGKKFNQIRHPDTPDSLYQEMWERIAKGEVWEGEIKNRKKNGESFWNMLSIAPVKNSKAIITHYISTHHDITEQKKMQKRLNFLAYHDELTGLSNRTLLMDRFNQTCARAHRSGHQLALLVLDLDRFKNINDTLGHSTGDKVLVEIANRLTDQARGGETITRYGGDEFVVLLSDVQDNKTIAYASQRILDIISEPIEVDGRTLHVTCSLGVAIWPDNGENLAALLSHADAAMYTAKEHGRDRFQFFTEELNAQNQKRMILESDMHHAIDKQEFELFYQPQINVTNQRIFGVEALIRWNHPTQGLIFPAQFIPLAEETGMILAIGQWTLETACRQIAQWNNAGYNLQMSVNVSVRQLEEPDFDMLLRQIITKTKIKAKYLELEITESTMMQDPESMIKVLQQVKQVGVKLALDDFGTGHSSLSYLQRFPFDKLKIDRSFINDVSQSADAAAIAKTIGAMAKSLHLEIIAEGVETQQQVDFLLECGCDQAQGFFYSRAINPIKLEQLFLLSPIKTR
jgi:diguanylate cyclase (GGDEF)-like protein/PAS domain S-box-containing protein